MAIFTTRTVQGLAVGRPEPHSCDQSAGWTPGRGAGAGVCVKRPLTLLIKSRGSLACSLSSEQPLQQNQLSYCMPQGPGKHTYGNGQSDTLVRTSLPGLTTGRAQRLLTYRKPSLNQLGTGWDLPHAQPWAHPQDSLATSFRGLVSLSQPGPQPSFLPGPEVLQTRMAKPAAGWPESSGMPWGRRH